jgi:hypothetical protein
MALMLSAFLFTSIDGVHSSKISMRGETKMYVELFSHISVRSAIPYKLYSTYRPYVYAAYNGTYKG